MFGLDPSSGVGGLVPVPIPEVPFQPEAKAGGVAPDQFSKWRIDMFSRRGFLHYAAVGAAGLLLPDRRVTTVVFGSGRREEFTGGYMLPGGSEIYPTPLDMFRFLRKLGVPIEAEVLMANRAEWIESGHPHLPIGILTEANDE
jgi:hypothetical protein